MSIINKLQPLRATGGSVRTRGLPDAQIIQFAQHDASLVQAIDAALEAFANWRQRYPELMDADELEQCHAVQGGFVNYYAEDAVNPYVALGAAGPWIVTSKGAVLYDCGGYGMLGFGHTPQNVMEVMSRPQAMANIMTPAFAQRRFSEALRNEIGHRRSGGCPFNHFMCLNSGSEATNLAGRIADVNAKLMTDPGSPKAHRKIQRLSLKGGFHGRTDIPARYSDSTRKVYQRHLASYRDADSLLTVEPNHPEQLRQIFEWADNNDVFIEAMFMEPVMGEGNPGMAVSPEFYALARELTHSHGSLLLVDSIQAGLRAHGVLSIMDYPGFETLDPPDMETYSKALNAGQYPLSVLALNERAADLYRKGIYGNTMTTNPRAIEIGTAVLEALTPQLRRNIAERGQQFIERLKQLGTELDGRITGVQGTGLLFSAEVDPARYKAYGTGSLEEYLRFNGVNVIHGGENSLRFTPHFAVSEAEVDLIIDAVRDALLNGPIKQVEQAA